MEKWPYPDVPVYVVHPRDGEGCTQTLNRNYLLLISSNMGQDEKDASMAGVESTNTSTPVQPGMVSLLMQGHLGQSYQAEQVTHLRVVWIHLLHLDMAH